MSKDLIDEREIATSLAGRAIDRLLSHAEQEVKERWAKHKNKSRSSFADYIDSKRRRCLLVRNLIYDTQSARLDNIYINTILSNARTKVTDHEFINLILASSKSEKDRPSAAIIVQGPAGCGKSFCFRHIYLSLTSSHTDKISVLIELRELNDREPTNFEQVLVDEFQRISSSISLEQVKDGLANGLFLMLLDGFDELSKVLERFYAKELIKFSEKYSCCPIVVAGRPARTLTTWAQFEIFNIVPLNTERGIALVEKIDFDEAVKTSFNSLVRNTLSETHQEFLESPLLVTVMLLTYSDVGKISLQHHEFFEDAYNALWNKHYARKEGYQRPIHTGLKKHQFTKIVASFAASSYVCNKFDFRDRDIQNHFANAKQMTQLETDDDALLHDLVISVNLLVEDGTVYRFTHRSFHEYFCAIYILGLPDDFSEIAIQEVSKRYETDYVLEFILALNDEKIEKNWALHRLEDHIVRVKEAGGSIKKYLEVCDSDFMDVLRTIYNFDPDRDEVLGAIDAALDMGCVEFGDFVSHLGDQVEINPIEQDRQNFMTLYSHLNQKYSDRDGVVRKVFGEKISQ